MPDTYSIDSLEPGDWIRHKDSFACILHHKSRYSKVILFNEYGALEGIHRIYSFPAVELITSFAANVPWKQIGSGD